MQCNAVGSDKISTEVIKGLDKVGSDILYEMLNEVYKTAGLWSRSWSRKESEVFGWSRSRIPNNTGSRSRIFLSDSDSGCPTGSVFTSHS